MKRLHRDAIGLTVAFLVNFGGPWVSAQVPLDPDEPARRSLAYLNREVPRWSRENRCYSCHNNGDGARAIFVALTANFTANGNDLAETLAFLARPEIWDKNGVDAAFSDKRLARVQFAAALGDAEGAGRVVDRSALARAADLLAKDQAEDGSWPIDEAAAVGSPTTWGTPLATALAIQALRRADDRRFGRAISRAEAWIRSRPIQNVHDASSILLVLIRDEPADRVRIADAVDFLGRSQNEDGGWGPFLRASSEPFDTALAMIALARATDRRDVREKVRRGRTFLVASQNVDGSWAETTRPPGGESYAQRISTTSWAAMALTVTEPSRLKAEGPPKS